MKNWAIASYIFSLSSSLCASPSFHPFAPKATYSSEEIQKSYRKIKRYIPYQKTNDWAPPIVYYFHTPACKNFPIVIFCSGSTAKENVASIYPIHHYFCKHFSDLDVGWITLEYPFIQPKEILRDHFMKFYTRTQRLRDHQQVITHLLRKPPKGWNGKLIFFGVSEGGCLVTALTEKYADRTLATINGSGADGWDYPQKLWNFFGNMRKMFSAKAPWYVRIRGKLPDWCPRSLDLRLPKTRSEYNQMLAQMLQNPVPNRTWIGMSYRYHADAIRWPKTNFSNLKTPYFIIAGDQDPAIGSSDAFVQKAKESGVNVTYLRLKNVDHPVTRKREAIEAIRSWMQTILAASQK